MHLKTGIPLTVLLLSGIFTHAQNLERDTIQLSEVEIRSSKLPQFIRSMMPTQHLSGAGLQAIIGTSAAEAIKTFAGVSLKDYGGIGGLKTVMVRSLSAQHTAVFLDGVAITDLATGTIDLGKIPLENIEEISLSIGQHVELCHPARTQASANSINLRSKAINFGTRKIRIHSGIKAGSMGLVSPSFKAGVKLSPSSHLTVSANARYAHGEYSYNIENASAGYITSTRKNSDIAAIHLGFSFIHILNDSAHLRFRTSYYDSERGLPGAVILYNPYARQRLWNRDLNTSVQYRSAPKRSIALLSNLAYSRSYLRYLDPTYPNMAGKLETRFTQQEFYLSQAASAKTFAGLSFSLSSDLIVHTLQADLYNYANPIRYTWLTAMGSYFQQKRFETQGTLLATVVREKTETGVAAEGQNVITPSFSMIYAISAAPKIQLRLLYKNILRMPTFNDLYYTFTGNTDLKPEYVSQLNGGLTFSHHLKSTGHISFATDAFYNYVNDKIVAVPTYQLFVWSMRNIGLVSIRGVEFQINTYMPFTARTIISYTGNYTNQQATDRTQKGTITYGHQVPYIPFETVAATLILQHRRLMFTYGALFNGFRYTLGQNIADNRLPAWW
ncbi:MAG: TonB-dependent receptor, partial [Bacteroidales bacterium]|nr:TonB-dependent receptor [Bacteroidales bacterium]